MAITGRNNNNDIRSCRIKYCARDGINLTGSLSTTVLFNRIEGCADDAISIHTTSAQGNPPSERHIVGYNIITDAPGIKMLGAVKATIIGNVLNRVHGYGVYFADESAEGNNDLLSVEISGNVINDVINANEFGGGNIQCGMFIYSSVTSFQAPVVGGGTPDINKPEAFSYLSNAANQNAGARGIHISNNIINGFTLPASSSYTDWGYGQAYTTTGFSNPDLSTGFHFNCKGIRLSGAILNITINNNEMEGLDSGVICDTDLTYLGEIDVKLNKIKRFAWYGLSLETSAQKYGRAFCFGNSIDGDPYLEHTNRNSDGTWDVAVNPCAVNYTSWAGVTIESNQFRNLNQVGQAAVASGQFLGNTYFMQPGAGATVAAFDNASKGIRQPWGIGDITSTLVWEDSTPTSATYGQELGRGQQSYDGLPTTAYWIPGQFAFNQAVTEASDPITGEKYTVWGYKRITSGNANVLNTDWREMRAYSGNILAPQTYSPADSGTVTINCSLGTQAIVTMAAATPTALTIAAPTNPVTGYVLRISIITGATSVPAAITWNAVFKKSADAGLAISRRGATSYQYDGTNWVQLGGALTFNA